MDQDGYIKEDVQVYGEYLKQIQRALDEVNKETLVTVLAVPEGKESDDCELKEIIVDVRSTVVF